MTTSPVNRGVGNRARAGTRALSLLSAPLNIGVLRALKEEPASLIELRRRCGSPAQTTLRAHLEELSQIGAIEKRRRDRFPGAAVCELTEAGRALLFVARVLEGWLKASPNGSLSFETGAAKGATKALADGWSSTIARAIAAGPRSLTELDRLIGDVSYPSLERRLGAMRLVGLVEARPSKGGRGTPYMATRWLRHGIAPLAASARWERLHASEESAPITRLDVEAAFLLAMPLLDPPGGLSGACRLAVEVPNGEDQRLAGVMVEVKDGAISSCTSRLNGDADAWALGSAPAWLLAVIEHDTKRLELGGEGRLVRALLDGLHGTLFQVLMRTS